jgi:hypothetical protein
MDDAKRQFERVREQVQLLTGERGDADRSKTAVRRGELRALASLKMRSTQIAGTPTRDDFNRLQADVEAVYAAFVLISNILGNARIPRV